MKQAILIVLLFAFVVPFLASGSPAPPAQAPELQFPQPSPLSFVRNQIGLTTVEIEYSRPSARDREIFGGLVPFGETWRTGANKATKITFSTGVTFGGKEVPAGSYALFTIPGESEWTFVLNEDTEQWGSYGHDASKDVARVTAKADSLSEPIETLWIGIDHLRDESGLLTIAWAKTRVQVEIGTDLVSMLVPRIQEAMVSGSDDKPYLRAAMFYYEHDLDLALALDWIEAAIELQPDAPWIVYRKGLILEKIGKEEEALAAAKRALELAKQAGGAVGDEYQRLSQDLIARLQS